MVKSASGDALQHGALAACVFAGDRQNSEKSARPGARRLIRLMHTVKERAERAGHPRPQVVARCFATRSCPSSD